MSFILYFQPNVAARTDPCVSPHLAGWKVAVGSCKPRSHRLYGQACGTAAACKVCLMVQF